MVEYSPIKGGGGEVIQITYQKKDGCIIQRLRNSMIPYKIGETTSMGWKVLNIEYEYNNQYYAENEFNKLIHKEKLKCIKRKRARELYTQEIKKFLYYILAITLIEIFKTLIGM